MEAKYFTTGQIAGFLRVSTSTLKRWLCANSALPEAPRNVIGWRLFTPGDLERLKSFKVEKKRNGKRFNPSILTPVG